MSDPVEDRYTKLDDDQLNELLKVRYGLELDEVKALFSDEEAKRTALRDMESLTRSDRVDDDSLGWDKTDKHKLTADQKREVGALRKQKEIAKQAKVKVKAAFEKLEQSVEQHISKKSIEETKADVTVADMKQSLSDLRKMMAEADDDFD